MAGGTAVEFAEGVPACTGRAAGARTADSPAPPAPILGGRRASRACRSLRWRTPWPSGSSGGRSSIFRASCGPARARHSRRWSQRGLKVGVFSDYPAEEKLKALRLDHVVSLSIDATEPDVNAFKPHPRGFLKAAERWDCGTDCHPVRRRPAGCGCGWRGRGRNALRRHWSKRAWTCCAGAAMSRGSRRWQTSFSSSSGNGGRADATGGRDSIRTSRSRGSITGSRTRSCCSASCSRSSTRRSWRRGTARWPLALAFAATCLTASSNYVLNELLDGPDRQAASEEAVPPCAVGPGRARPSRTRNGWRSAQRASACRSRSTGTSDCRQWRCGSSACPTTCRPSERRSGRTST